MNNQNLAGCAWKLYNKVSFKLSDIRRMIERKQGYQEVAVGTYMHIISLIKSPTIMYKCKRSLTFQKHMEHLFCIQQARLPVIQGLFLSFAGQCCGLHYNFRNTVPILDLCKPAQNPTEANSNVLLFFKSGYRQQNAR